MFQTKEPDKSSEELNKAAISNLPNKEFIPYDPTIPLLGIHPDESIIGKDTCTLMLTAALFTIAKTQKQPKCPLIEEWTKKIWYIYAMDYYSP